MTDKILIIEDDQDIANLIKVHMDELGLDATTCCCGKKGLEQALNQDFQLILLDVMLPQVSGLDICRQLRDAKPLQSIVMLTARSSETDRVLGLELGADDYLSKPFSVRELQARVRAQLRRVHCTLAINPTPSQDAVTCIGELMVDHQCHKVTYRDTAIELTSTEFELLSFLGRHPDQVFSRSQLLDSVWGYHHSGYEHTVNSHINRLRNKLEKDVSTPQIIQTVWGVGYKLNSAGVH
ncbi:winged helix-turn-helix domain-containing protein [Thalassotalea euphylliae]|uniref:winged helix-turn-helix domain-containing protein n=1 Tax=Thalassotalea euphylliae TaxID=1655234 RepID=UPI003643D220